MLERLTIDPVMSDQTHQGNYLAIHLRLFSLSFEGGKEGRINNGAIEERCGGVIFP